MIWGNAQNVYVTDDGNPFIFFDDCMISNSGNIVNDSGGTVTLNSCDDNFPYFSDPDNGDYSLSTFSPLIGAGNTQASIPDTEYVLYAPSEDILGNPRPSPTGSNPDIGAYENSNGQLEYNPNRYVSIYGDNNNPGIITSPWRDIQYAIDQAQDSDIIHVAAGT